MAEGTTRILDIGDEMCFTMQHMRRSKEAKPARRLRKWQREMGMSTATLAERAEVSRQMMSSVLNGTRLPGRRLANTIARLTAVWVDGPISTTEWDEAEDRARAAEETAAA